MRPTGTSELGVLLRLTTAIGHTHAVGEIYDAALDALADGLGVRRASILLFDADGVMRFKAWRALSGEYRAAVEGHSPWTRAAADAEPIVVTDIAGDPAVAPFASVLRAEGIAGLAFVPLVASGHVIGKFVLYFDAPRRLDGEELTFASIVASQVAFAVERTRAQASAARSEERLRFALDAAAMGTWDWDLASNVVRWSEGIARVHGLAPDSFGGTLQAWEREIHPDDRERVRGLLQRAVDAGAPYDVEYRVVAPDGTVRWVEGKGRVERGAGGAALRMSGVCMDITPRKHAELARVDALEESHLLARRIAAVVEWSDDAIISKNLDGIIASWNPAAERMFGFSAAEAVGDSIMLIVPDDRRAEEADVLRRIRAGETIENFETVRRRKDGRLIEVSLTVSPVGDETGRIAGASTIARDVTARKQGERELADLHRRLTTLIGASASLLDRPYRASVERATIAIAHELVAADAYAMWRETGDGWRLVTSEGLSDRFSARILDSFTEGAVPSSGTITEPVAIADIDQSPIPLQLAGIFRGEGIRSMLVCPMRFGGDSGTLVFYYRSRHGFTDVEVQTAQALANLAAAATTTADLYEEQRRQRAAAEYASRQAAFLAEAGAVLARSLDYHQTLTAVAQLAVPEIADWCAVDIVEEDGRARRLAVAHSDAEKLPYARMLEERYPSDPEVPGTVAHVIRTGRPAMMETLPENLLMATAVDDGHRHLLRALSLTSYMCVPLVANQRTLGALTFVYAESGRHYTQADLRFAQEVAARASLAIENAHAYQRAHEANRLKDDFLATLSHELRTPLNAILGYAQMLAMGVLEGDKEIQALTVVRRNAESLKQIIDDVLDVSRITAGKLRLNVRPVDLGSIVKNAVATLQPAADAKGVRVQTIIDAGLPAVSGDADRLQQVAWNLLSNAVKFTPRGGRVQVRVEQVNSHAEIVVSDTGLGIEPAFLSHLFERFRQADSRFSREHGGLGLGLSIVRDLVQLHGGSVSASSEGIGKGATFRVELPLMIVYPPRLDVPATHPRAEQYAATDVRLDGVRVLAVDDEEDALGLLRDILETAGAEVTTVGSAARALEALQHDPPDVLISDIGMPRQDGIELIRTVRQALPAPLNRVPALALTAYARSEDRVTALVSGFQMHLAKPVNPSELVVAVGALVRRER